MGITSVFVLLIVGAVAGWLAGKIVKGSGFGLIGNIVIGILGAFIATLLLPAIGLPVGGGMLGSIISATIGAVILLFLLQLLKRKS
ncbi:GlsB/YeaQ/YmgE family stress response membrane protein [Neptunicoccus sediminis]|uniref:GlsB/YeaQ/YmgE family stress response membrane protein n=1 Tax=Neptunicoccus sediminis TaxID=1892596 RepID=UPI000845F8EB|nr:GlsB/YeaQ/YmgE family stress response membrane protein [Neptunicoccus sediminis]